MTSAPTPRHSLRLNARARASEAAGRGRLLSLLTQDAAKVDQGSAAPPRRTTARPLHTGFPNIFGAAVSEAAMRPDPYSVKVTGLAQKFQVSPIF